MLFRMALLELRRSWRFALFFIFNLSLGLTGFVSLEAFKDAIQNQISTQARTLLSADIAVSARRQITEDEIKKIRSVVGAAPESMQYEFFAMINSDRGSRLVMVKAIDDQYPFYGELTLGSGEKIVFNSSKEILKQNSVWIYPELQSQMGLQVGENLKLGQLNLKIADTIKKDGTQTFRVGALAPRIFIHRDLLAQSGLIQFGSTFSMSYLYKLPPTADLAVVKEKLYDVLKDPAVQVDTPQSAGEDSGRQLAYLSDYLGLVAIIALFMSILGASYIYRLYLTRKLKEVAILRSLGLQSLEAVGIYVWQVLILGLLACFPTLIASLLILPLLSALLSRFTPFDLEPTLSPTVFLVSLAMSLAGSFVVSFPFLLKIYDLKPAKLFSEEKFSVDISIQRLWPFLPAILIFWGLSIYQAHSWKIGSYFVLALAGVLLGLSALAWVGLQLIVRLQVKRFWFIKFSLLGLRRRKAASFAIFIAIGLGALLMNILPQLKQTLQQEFQVEKSSKLPSLFMFDIQDEQLPGLLDYLKTRDFTPSVLSPMIRARILKVNGEDYERKIENQSFKTREEEREARFRNRGINLSYRVKLSDSETLLSGRDFSPTYDPAKKAELSVEYKFAERMGFKLGDQLIFDVQGVPVEGEVINLRKVKWTSFEPNFFILIQDGVLNEAPKTFIAALPNMSAEIKSSLQNELAQKFTNVSVIDVARTVDDILNVATQMSWSLELMAALALLTGYIVLYSIIRAQIRLRRWELNMLKILGSSWRELMGFILVESLTLTLLSSVAGALLSVLVSFGLSFYVFETSFSFSLFWPLISVITITVLSLVVALLASFDVLRESPLGILRNEG